MFKFLITFINKLLACIFMLIILVGAPLNFVNAASCIPTFRGNYSVEGNCSWPGNYKVYGNISFGTRTVTVPSGITIGINLAAQRATFSTGKIVFGSNSRMQNTSSNGYYTSMSHSLNSGFRNCPSGMNVLNMTPSAYQGSAVTVRPTAGVFYCGK